MTKRVVATAVCVVVLMCAGSANADWVDDFQPPPPAFTWSWTDNGSTGIGRDTVPSYLRLYSPWGFGGVQVPPTAGSPSIVVGEVQSYGVSTNGTITAIINPGAVANPPAEYTDDSMGLLIRSNGGAGTGYAAVVNLAGSTFGLYRSDNPFPPAPGIPILDTLDEETGLGLDLTQQYSLLLRAIDDDIYAALFDSGGSLVAEVQATDDTYDSGYAGLVAVWTDPNDFPGADNVLFASFDNVSAVFGIPEPSTVLLLSLGGLGLLGFARRRRKR